MPGPERQRMDELVSLYELEPGIRDIFVEGEQDRAILEWFFSEIGDRAVSIKEISSVDVPASQVRAHNLDENNRGRVITLAIELQGKLGNEAVAATCVIDADFDRLLGIQHNYPLLLTTDFTCFEMYLCEEPPLNKLLRLCALKCPYPASKVLADLRSALTELFLARAANHTLKWGMTVISFEKCCEMRGAVILDRQEYVTRLLNANRRTEDRAVFLNSIEEYRKRLPSDPRHHAHGHDFINLLAWYFRQLGSTNSSVSSAMRFFWCCVESSALLKYPLFANLVTRIGTQWQI